MYLFLDTETTGVPRTRGAPSVAVRQWPRLGEVAWAAYGEAGKWLAAEEHLAYPAGFAVPAATTRIHGISTAKAKSHPYMAAQYVFPRARGMDLLLVPVLMPLINALGIDPVHFGVVFTLNLMIGLITPPVGMSMFIACSIAKIRLVDFAREIPLFVVALVLVLLLITYYPPLVLFLPNLVMGK